MSSGLVLDTWAPELSTSFEEGCSSDTSQAGFDDKVFFHHLVEQLLKSSRHDRNARRQSVIDRLSRSRDPMGYIGELLGLCVVDHRSKGMDIAIDVLAHFGQRVVEYGREFWRKDADRWKNQDPLACHNVHDDVWYVMIRAAGLSELGPWDKIPMLTCCILEGTPVLREGSIRALGDVAFGCVSLNDLGEQTAKLYANKLIRHRLEVDPSPMVRETAAEVLDDLEG